jgi:hypothetical protein
MNAFLDYAKTNNVVPDYISWHDAGGGGDPVNDQATINKAISSRWIGTRIAVTAGTQVDAVAYQDACAAKSIVVVGNKGGVTGSVNVVIKNIPAWLQTGGSTKVLLERMPAGTAALSAPAVVSNAATTLNCNSTVVTINWATATDGYVVTLSPP